MKLYTPAQLFRLKRPGYYWMKCLLVEEKLIGEHPTVEIVQTVDDIFEMPGPIALLVRSFEEPMFDPNDFILSEWAELKFFGPIPLPEWPK